MSDCVDVLIIGCGVAGLFTAKHLPSSLNVVILCKTDKNAANTYWAQGGIACSKDESDVEAYIADTIAAGAGLCDETAVRTLCEGSREVVSKLINDGMIFDTDKDGNLLYTQEAAHSTNRILHADGDATGRKLQEFLLSKNKFPIYENSRVIDLLVEDGVCYGVTVIRDGQTQNIYAKAVVIASGGVGSIYKYSTNDSCISADIHGIAALHGIALRDMQMMQFHPTVYSDNTFARKVLLTEALRGEGAFVVNEKGERFLTKFDARGEMAPRDIVSRAIIDEANATKGNIYLSFDTFEQEFFQKRFPNIYENMLSLGFSLPRDKVPIYPAFHYAIGGIECGLDTRVTGYKNLFVVGEAANNRVHGANRLASNSLLEGLVFGKITAKQIMEKLQDVKIKEFKIMDEPLLKEGDTDKKNSLRELMWHFAGVVRTENDLQEAKIQIKKLLEEPIGRLTKLRLLAALAIIQACIDSPSMGAHYKSNPK